ncbi:hypothetical protein [Ignicoccus hospitalis]|uniref:Uncharacterized protein n=1 Tax=Ignicoccus hospitalis (strain KIN4/I / DSM 18386 / JCM 14125) TaxID=453591 RepID=A8A8V7_IGNH4|nr:hypothetical protein [Ignicoccus hospitalis]ABU81359.1 hypothetical protein Igni_0175 [Ignicoccus hospitalis KIN4/I]HIH90337.1 hypothetical protein [Desulfurococcaceae archaeon]
MEETKKVTVFEGEARIGLMKVPTLTITLEPEDFESPLSFQMALSKLMDELTKAFENPPESKYFAEVKFRDHLNRPVFVAVDLGKSIPPFSKNKVKARIVVEIYEEE